MFDRCECGYEPGPDVSVAEASAVCPGCGRPVGAPDSLNTRPFFLSPADPDPFAATRSDADGPAEHVLKLKGKPPPTPPPDVPGYEILGELGRGGMGVVYKARELALNRVVALKMILTGSHATDAERERFRREAAAVAALQHPAIVQIFRVAEHAGQPYLALEFVDGGNLAQRIAAGDLMPAGEAAAAVEQLARAMQYAHDRGIIHRDLKPANILLAKEESGSADSALFKISDFGLAKKVDDTIAAGGGTKTGAVMGTPSYIAPEQASGKAGTVTPAADVYSLGAILYELLTGRPPFRADTPLETVLQVLNDDPVPPARLRPKLPRDLETICLKCLTKDPARRYPTATALADDLGRFRRGEPIRARPLAPLARGLRWARRHPAVTAVAATAALAVVAVVAVLATTAARLTELNRQKETEADIAREQKRVADRLRAESDSLAGEVQAANEVLREQDERNRRNLYALQLAQVAGVVEKDPARAAQLLDDPDRCPAGLRDFAWRYLRHLCTRDERVFTGHRQPIPALAVSPDGSLAVTTDDAGEVRLWSPKVRTPFALLSGHPGRPAGAAFSPDGTAVAVGARDGTVRVWKLPPAFLELVRTAAQFLPQTQAELAQLLPPGMNFSVALRPAVVIPAFRFGLRCVAFSPDGRYLATGGADRELSPGRWEGVAKVWDLAAVLPSNLLAAAAGAAAPAAAVQMTTRTVRPPVRTFAGHFMPVSAVAFAPDGRTLATGGEDHGVQLVPLAGDGRPELLRQHGGPVSGVAFAPDGRTLATIDNAAESPAVVLWDLTRRRPAERVKLIGHEAVRAVAFSPDGRQVATGGGGRFDASVRVWDADTGAERTRLVGHRGAVAAVGWLPDGRAVVSASDDGTARVWQTAVRPCDTAAIDFGDPARVLFAATTGSGRTLVTADDTGAVRLWATDALFDAKPGAAELPLRLENPKAADERRWRPTGFAVADSGVTVAAASAAGLVVWDLTPAVRRGDPAKAAVVPVRWLSRGGPVSAVRLTADGTRAFAVTVDGLRVWDVASGKDVTAAVSNAPAGPPTLSPALAVTPDGALAAYPVRVNGRDELAVVAGGEPVLLPLPAAQTGLLALDFSPDGKHLAVAGYSGTRVFEVRTVGGMIRELKPVSETAEVTLRIRFGPAGNTLWAVNFNREVRVLDPLTGQERATLAGHAERIVGLGLLPREAAAITVGADGVVKRWRADVTPRFDLRQLPGLTNRPGRPDGVRPGGR